MLLTGRILLQHSTTTERVHQTIQQLAEKFGVEVRVYCEYEAITLTELIQKLEKIDKYPPIYYPRWFIILMLGLTGASLAPIFQGD